MHILTNVVELQSAKSTLKSCDIEFSYMKKSVFDLAGYNPTMVISTNTEECNRAARRFPNIQFVAPKAKFPGFPCNIYTGFDITSLDNKCQLDVSGQVCFVNTRGNVSKVFGMKLESVYDDVKIFGNGSGISSIGPVNINTTVDLYRKFDIVAADCPSEIYKALYLNKPCITSMDFTCCHNIFGANFSVDTCNVFPDQKQFALENTYYDVFSYVFENSNNQYLVPKLTHHKAHYVQN